MSSQNSIPRPPNSPIRPQCHSCCFGFSGIGNLWNTPPKFNIAPKKMVVGRLLSYWEGDLYFGRVIPADDFPEPVPCMKELSFFNKFASTKLVGFTFPKWMLKLLRFKIPNLNENQQKLLTLHQQPIRISLVHLETSYIWQQYQHEETSSASSIQNKEP